MSRNLTFSRGRERGNPRSSLYETKVVTSDDIIFEKKKKSLLICAKTETS